MIGTVIAHKYRLLQRLARGGMGMVFLAEHIHLSELRAIKILPSGGEGKHEFVPRFFREIRVTHKASRESEHIVRIYDDFDVVEGLGCYYVMEYLEGESLAERMDQDPRNHDESWCINIGLQICSAMQAVHAQGIVHRDLKPDNLLLVNRKGYGDFVKLVDFGIALPTQSQESIRMTRPGITHGTPHYMSPEQIMGPSGKQNRDTYLDGRSDQYSLACILFEMLTGRPPFLKRRNDPEYVLFQHLNSRPPSVLEFRTNVSAMWDDVLHRALSKLPEDRFPTMDDFARHLQYLNHTTRPSVPSLTNSQVLRLKELAISKGILQTQEASEEDLAENTRQTITDLRSFADTNNSTPVDLPQPSFAPVKEELLKTFPEARQKWQTNPLELNLDEDHPVRQMLDSLSLGKTSPSVSSVPSTPTPVVPETKAVPSLELMTTSVDVPLPEPLKKSAPDDENSDTNPRATSLYVPRSSEVFVSNDADESEEE